MHKISTKFLNRSGEHLSGMELYKHELFRNFSPNSDNASANFFKFNLLSSRGVKPILSQTL